MSEVAQEVDTSIVAEAPAVNESADKAKAGPEEAPTKETDVESPEVEGQEPEKTAEEKLADLQSEAEKKQKAIDRKTAAYSALQKTYEKQQQELNALRESMQAQEPEEAPKLEDFDTFEDYDAKRVEYLTKQAEKKAQENLLEQQQERARKEREAQMLKQRQEQEAEYVQLNPAYPASVQEVQAFINTSNISPATAEAVLDVVYSGNVPQVLDYFGKNGGENLDKLAEISAMPPVQAGIEIYKIQQALKTPEPQKVQSAPKPVNKPKGGGAPRKDLKDGSVLKNLGLKD